MIDQKQRTAWRKWTDTYAGPLMPRELGRCKRCGHRFKSTSDLLEHTGLVAWANLKRACPKADMGKLIDMKARLYEWGKANPNWKPS